MLISVHAAFKKKQPSARETPSYCCRDSSVPPTLTKQRSFGSAHLTQGIMRDSGKFERKQGRGTSGLDSLEILERRRERKPFLSGYLQKSLDAQRGHRTPQEERILRSRASQLEVSDLKEEKGEGNRHQRPALRSQKGTADKKRGNLSGPEIQALY